METRKYRITWKKSPRSKQVFTWERFAVNALRATEHCQQALQEEGFDQAVIIATGLAI